MSDTINISSYEVYKNIARQACVIAIRKAELPTIVKAEAEQFIQRNILEDCGRVAPNCLKAFLVKTINKMGLEKMIPYVKNLFKSKVGYEGYYLDAGKLCRINDFYDFRQAT